MSVRRRFASPSTEKPRFLILFQRKSPHNFCTKILHITSCDRVGWSGCSLPQISPISTDKLHSACEESVFICRADGAICVIGKHPAGICVPQCDLWAYKTPAWPHSAFNHSSSDGPFHVQHSNISRSTFHIPHNKLFLSARVRAAVTVRHLLRWLLSRQPPPSVVFADPKGAHPRSPNCRRAKVFPCSYHCFAMVT